MKKIVLCFTLLTCLGSLFGQSDVYLQVHHFFGTAPFSLNTAATNNLGHQFSLTRLEYYLAEITLVHDGGMETEVQNKWILVNGDTQVDEFLGNFNLTNLEAIYLSVGVQESVNHLDPAQYPMTHPLAPKSPSMHWGWAGGYRFIAFEGKSGTNFAQTIQIHTVGNRNYLTDTIPVTGTMNGSDLVISIDADYTEALRDIPVDAGVFNHGDLYEARDLIENFTTVVFKESGGSVNADDARESAVNLTLAPNPTSGTSFLQLEGAYQGASIRVIDLQGRTVLEDRVNPQGSAEISIQEPGLYFVQVQKDGNALRTEKLLVTE